jgi:predicted hotdog family 3-hydroxylacyl-ACP dehydratase
MLDRHWIAAHIPHQDGMSLLEQIESWGPEYVRCQTSRHRDSAIPMRSAGRLGAACGIEFAAQAMALHGALIAEALDTPPPRPRAGLLVSVRNVQLNVVRLDDIEDDLLIEVRRLSGGTDNVMYEFQLRDNQRVLITGRATVILDAEITGK